MNGAFMIISFSGIDSAGKSTQIDLLCERLRYKKIRAKKVWSKARGTPGVLFLKEIVRRDKHMDITEKIKYRNEVFKNPKKQKLLYIASMLDLCWYWGVYYRILNIFYKYIICDRYLWDTYVELNQDFKDVEIDKSALWKIVKTIAPIPKHSFVFIIPAEISLQRDKQKNAAGIEDISKKTSKINTYMKCVEQNRWTNVMDGMKSIDELHHSILHILGLEI